MPKTKERFFEFMRKLKKCTFISLIFYSMFSLFCLDAEIDRAKTYLYFDAIQNWKTETIDANLQLVLQKANLKLPADRQEAFSLLDRYAPYLLQNIYLSVVVDSSHLLGNYLAESSISFDNISSVVENTNKSKAKLSANLKTSNIYGSTDLLHLSKLFIKHKNPYTPTIPPLTGSSKKYTGIIIDARGNLPVHGEYINDVLQPALFPKIWDSNMNLIFEKNMVEPIITEKRLIVKYTDTLNEKNYSDIVGKDPLRIVARGVFGVFRTDPIISNLDASKILSNQNLDLIRGAKVVIICDNLIKVPKYPQPDENFYFAYHDIETKVGDGDNGITVEQRPDDNIIKITMYNIHFVADQAIILPEDYGRIDVIAEALRRLGKNVRFVIEGHTAELNRPNDQQILSEQRASEMANELAKRGIERERITTLGFGATVPIAPSTTEENKAKNRRVEIKILRN